MVCILVLQDEEEGNNFPTVSAKFQETTSLNVLDAEQMVRAVQAVGAMVSTKMATL